MSYRINEKRLGSRDYTEYTTGNGSSFKVGADDASIYWSWNDYEFLGYDPKEKVIAIQDALWVPTIQGGTVVASSIETGTLDVDSSTTMTGNLEVAGTTKFGDISGGDYTELRTDGTVRGYGTATAWKDMIADLFGKRLLSQVGKVDYDYNENAIVFASGGVMATANDRVGGNLEINHEFKIGSDITFKPHLHWWQQVTDGGVDSFVWTLRYRLQRNNALKVSSWTTITCSAGTSDDIFDFTGESNGLYNQLSRFDDITVTCGVSDTIQFQMTRTDTTGGTVSVYFMDLHGEVDSWGSEDEITKT